MTRRSLVPLTLVLIATAALAAGIEPPPGVVAMWDGRDAASVRAALLAAAAQGEQPGASASRKLDAGEAAYWLGMQDAHQGRADSALAQWRRAVRLRGDFDEGFALIDELFRRGRPADVTEAYGLASTLAGQAQLGVPKRVIDAQARLAWALHLRGHSDSALAGLGGLANVVRRRPVWTRRLARIELAAGADSLAWKTLTLLSARTRRQDAEVESLLVNLQHKLHYIDERRQITVDLVLDPILNDERAFLAGLNADVGTLRADDGFQVRWFHVPAATGKPRREPLLFVLAPDDTLTAADVLAGSFAASGRSVVLLAPRGAYGALGPGAMGPDVWLEHTTALEAAEAKDAVRVMDLIAKRGEAPGGAWLVGAAGSSATVALAIARARKNDVRALVLVAPKLPVVDVAEYRARLRELRARTYVQVSPEEPESIELGDLLARQTQPGQVRVADSGLAGRGAAIFRGDPKVPQRLMAWLEEKAEKK